MVSTAQLKKKFGLATGVKVKGLLESMLLRYKFAIEGVSVSEIESIEFDEELDVYKFRIKNLDEVVNGNLPKGMEVDQLKEDENFFPVSEDDLEFIIPLKVKKLDKAFNIEEGMIDSEEYTISKEMIQSLVPFIDLMNKRKDEYEEFIDYEEFGIKIDEDTTISLKDLNQLAASSDL